MDSKAWDDRYKGPQEQIPWDTGLPAPELVEYFKSIKAVPARALEIGCGTGTNAIWLAEQGCRVLATDVSPTAIATAIQKGKDAKVDVTFAVEDILEKCSAPAGTIDFVFDRGVFHVIDVDKRELFVSRIADALSPGSYWLCLAGCADEEREDPTTGPPQLTASELIAFPEKLFEVHKLERGIFSLPDGKEFLAWVVLFRKR